MTAPRPKYLTIHGSRAYGLEVPESDVDLRGFFLPTLDQLLSFRGVSDSWGQMGGPYVTAGGQIFDDADVMLWDIRKYFRLAAAANPNVLETLFTDDSDVVSGGAGWNVRGSRHLFLSRKVRDSFGGYAVQQLRKVKTAYWDLAPTRKDAMHLLRLIDFGQQLLRDGNLRVRIDAPVAQMLRGVRAGLYSKEHVLAVAEMQLEIMDTLEKRSDLPKEPDLEALDELLYKILDSYVVSPERLDR